MISTQKHRGRKSASTYKAGKRGSIFLSGSAAAITLLWPHSAIALGPTGNSATTSLQTLQTQIKAQKAQLQQVEVQLEQQALKLDQEELLLNQQLKDTQLNKLHGRGPAPAQATPGQQTAQSTPSAQPPSPQSADGRTSIQGPTPSQQQTRTVLQTDTALSSNGGVLTPRGHIIIDPSVEYDYYSYNQLAVNGFTIIPGLTFGNIYVERVQQNVGTFAVTGRWGVTNRLELNVKVPIVAEYGITTTQAVGPNAIALTPSANNVNIGDIQLGAS